MRIRINNRRFLWQETSCMKLELIPFATDEGDWTVVRFSVPFTVSRWLSGQQVLIMLLLTNLCFCSKQWLRMELAHHSRCACCGCICLVTLVCHWSEDGVWIESWNRLLYTHVRRCSLQGLPSVGVSLTEFMRIEGYVKANLPIVCWANKRSSSFMTILKKCDVASWEVPRCNVKLVCVCSEMLWGNLQSKSDDCSFTLSVSAG